MSDYSKQVRRGLGGSLTNVPYPTIIQVSPTKTYFNNPYVEKTWHEPKILVKGAASLLDQEKKILFTFILAIGLSALR